MKKGIKYALVFTGGAVVGFGVCGVKLIGYALCDSDIRKGITNKITRKFDKCVYGDEETSGQYPNGAARASYKRYYDRQNKDNKYVFGDLIFDSGSDALQVVEEIEKAIDVYGCASVADLYNMTGNVATYEDTQHGWTNIRDYEIESSKDGFVLILPTPKLIK